jgi:hypothetical protein
LSDGARELISRRESFRELPTPGTIRTEKTRVATTGSGMTAVPDDALVVRGGQNLPDSFIQASGVTVDVDGKVQGVSVNAGAGAIVDELTAANPQTGYPGIPHTHIGVTTAGAIRAAGGDIVASPTRTNRHHATINGLTPEKASDLFRPTRTNPNARKR